MVNIHIYNFIKLWRKGRIDKLYNSIYCVATNLATWEVNQYYDDLLGKWTNKKVKCQNIYDFSEKIMKYKRERIEFHRKEMLNLLKERLKEEVENKK